jgi:hypothetical protein
MTNIKELRNIIRSVIQDDALYKRRDLPGDLDDPVAGEECDSDCDCDDCSGKEDYVTPKYALYSMIESAIDIYDRMEDESFEDDMMNQKIFKIAEIIHRMKVE